MTSDLADLIAAIRAFAAERDWEQFNSPKNLAGSVAIEAGELLEHFQWLTDAQSRALPPDKVDAVSLEIADVLLYLLNLADHLGIDVVEAAQRKMALNAQKYPAERFRGSAKKYNEP